MSKNTRPLPALPPLSPLEMAQELMDEAWQTSPFRAEAIAREALERSPDCVDAYLLLGQLETEADKKTDWFQGAVHAAERLLGAEAFTGLAGDFWGFLETRPYMRAVEALALHLHSLGRLEQAMAWLRKMLDLNPWDNQGARHALLPLLLRQGLDAEAETLFERYAETPFANWAYARVLLDYRSGEQEEAQKSLHAAMERNPFIPLYLLGERAVPAAMPGASERGSPEEAMWYAVNDKPAWEASPGALEWLDTEWRNMREDYPLEEEEWDGSAL